jgi:peroxiredoxin
MLRRVTSFYARHVQSRLLTFALVAALGLSVVLVQQSRKQRAQIATLRLERELPHSGQWVPAVRTVTVTGDSVTLGGAPGGRRQLLFLFTTTCQFCRQSLPAWKEIAARVQREHGASVEVLGVALDSVPLAAPYAATHRLPYPVTHFPSARMSRVYAARAVPVTVVIDSAGRIAYARARAVTTPEAIDSIVAAAAGVPLGPPTARVAVRAP